MANHHAAHAGKPLAKGPVRARAGYAADVTRPDWLKSRRKFALSATAVIVSALLAAPTPALAATYLEVDGTGYDAANGPASGEGWSWDGADDMVLDGYNGGYIYAEGALNIQLEGENTVSGQAPADPDNELEYYGDAIGVYDSSHKVVDENGEERWITDEEGDLTITGDGSLSVTSGQEGIGIYANGSIGIEGTSVEVNAEGEFADGIRSDWEGITIKDSEVSVSAKAKGEGEMATAIHTYEGDVIVESSKLSLDASSATYAFGINAGDEDLYGSVLITDSDVSVTTRATGSAAGEVPSGTWGISAFNGDVAIKGSNVTAKGSGGMCGDGIAAYGSDAYDGEGKSPAHVPTVLIKNSNVSVAGFPDSAIASIFDSPLSEDGTWDAALAKRGKIVIEGSIISLPFGAKVLDAEIVEPGFAAQCGQIIGTGEGIITEWESPAIAREVVVKSVKTVIDDALEDSGLPTTGDGTSPVPLLAAGLTAAAAAAFARRQLEA